MLWSLPQHALPCSDRILGGRLASYYCGREPLALKCVGPDLAYAGYARHAIGWQGSVWYLDRVIYLVGDMVMQLALHTTQP